MVIWRATKGIAGMEGQTHVSARWPVRPSRDYASLPETVRCTPRVVADMVMVLPRGVSEIVNGGAPNMAILRTPEAKVNALTRDCDAERASATTS